MFMDEAAITEVIKLSDNRMNVNNRKAKEMVLGPLARNPLHQLNIGNPTLTEWHSTRCSE